MRRQQLNAIDEAKAAIGAMRARYNLTENEQDQCCQFLIDWLIDLGEAKAARRVHLAAESSDLGPHT